VEGLPVFFADEKGEVKLPGGVSIRLAGMALWRSWEFDMEEVSPRDYDLEWRDPMSGDEIDDVHWKPFPYVANKEEQGPNLLLKFSVSDSNLVTSGNKVEAYNSRNLTGVSSIGYHPLRPNYTYWVYLHAWNQHSVRVSMEVYFGEREIQPFPGEVGEKIRFGEHAEIELLAKSNKFISGNTTT
jgi:hypothetical protein